MKKEDPWFFEMMAEAFVSLVLTKHNDVKVVPDAGLDHNMDLNLRIVILKDGKPTVRFFGAQLIPYLDLPDLRMAELGVFSHSRASVPICVFVIGIRKPEGIYRWSAEPLVEDGRAVLRPNEDPNWQPLDDAGAARLISQVNAWYDALAGNGALKSQARHAKSES
jgi:hypothetical protein